MVAVSGVSSNQLVRFQKIAVLTDFSECAGTALRYAAILARSYEAQICLAHAYVPTFAAFAAPDVSLVYKALDDLRDSLEKRLREQARSAFLAGVKCSIAVSVGGTDDLMKVLGDADIVVVGTTGKSGFEKAIFGSTAESIFRRVSVPVLIVGPGCARTEPAKAAIHKVLYATDLSPRSEICFPFAASIAHQYRASLLVLHAVPDDRLMSIFDAEVKAQQCADRYRKSIPECEVLCSVECGSPGKVILDKANDFPADMIVVGARGSEFSSIACHLGGGTAYHVAAHAHCPVLTVCRLRTVNSGKADGNRSHSGS
ncbi:universal stress protein [Silvibacterium acidisoli]|uniref:universal stress protein n=1 Tax=Acidobacteriaceae bacterium ZG23-2 TaxID=2883246 RepID=UPI00406D093E